MFACESLSSLLPTGRGAPGLGPCSLHTEDPTAGGEWRKPVTAVPGAWPAALQLPEGEPCGLGALGHDDGAAPVSTGLPRCFRRKHQKHTPRCGSRGSCPASSAFLFTSDQRGPETKPAGWRRAEAEEQDSQRVRPGAPWGRGVSLPNCPCWLTERAAHSPPAALGPGSSWVSPFPGQPRLDARRSRHPVTDRASLPAASPLHITRTHRFCLRSFQQPPRSSSLSPRASWGPFTLPGPGRARTAAPDSGPSPVGQLAARLPVHAVCSRGRTGETGGPRGAPGWVVARPCQPFAALLHHLPLPAPSRTRQEEDTKGNFRDLASTPNHKERSACVIHPTLFTGLYIRHVSPQLCVLTMMRFREHESKH